MVPAQHRMHRTREFQQAVRAGRRAGGTTLVVHAALTSANHPARVGLIVSRNVGPAVLRNRVKRRLRHLIVPYLPDLPDGSLVVVRALPAARDRLDSLPADLSSALSRALGRARVDEGTAA